MNGRWPTGVDRLDDPEAADAATLFDDYVKHGLQGFGEQDTIVPQSTNDEDSIMKWSTNQQAVFNWFKDCAQPLMAAVSRALVVKAVAGSGKTTTIVEAARFIPIGDLACFLAFNKAIATELGNRLPRNIESRTLNSLGFRAVKAKFPNCDVDGDKVRKIIKSLDDIYSTDTGEDYVAKYLTGAIANLVAKCKAHGLVPFEKLNGELATDASLQELMNFYDITADAPDSVIREFALEALKVNCQQTNIVDFDDQLYFVVAFDLMVPQYRWIIVDEAQDLSHINREMLKKFLALGGKLIAVGDERQAIYGFRGADSSSLERIVTEFNADELPLDTTYRCPRKVVEVAQRYVPEINCPDDAPEGEVIECDKFSIADFIDSDLVVCRNTAPLISSAYRLIRNGQSVRVMGRDIGKGLVSLIKKLAKREFTTISMEDFEKRVNEWRNKQIEIVTRRDQENKIEGINDKSESLLAIISGGDLDTLQELVNVINSLFNGHSGPKFATVHRAKGLEAPRVFILDSHLMPSAYAKQKWQRKQETNLIYVAVTRALETLCYVESKRLV